MKMPFSIKSSAPSSDQPAIRDWLIEQSREYSGQPLYALLDGAQIEGLPSTLQKLAKKSYGPLCSMFARSDAEAAGGWLIDVMVDAGQSSKCLNMTCDAALAHPAVMWLQSPLGLDELLKLLGSRINAQLKRGPETLFRYYDPRIFTNWVGALKPEQAPFLSMASRWYWFDHAFNRCILDHPIDIEAARRFKTPFEIDQDQEKVLIENSLPYEVMQVLEEGDPEALQSIPLETRYAIIKQGVDRVLSNGQRSLLAMVETCLEILAARRGANEH